MGFADADLSTDAFLNGRVTITQPRKGFRSGADAVYLAAAVPAKAGQSVLELGCGAGAAILCLAARVPGLRLSGVEVQAAYADLARANARRAGADMTVHTADLTAPPPALKALSFDHVIANPPYFLDGSHDPAPDAGRAVARGAGADALAAWIDAGIRRLAPRGYLTLILKAPRLADALRALDDRVGSIAIRGLHPRRGRDAELVVIQTRKGARGPLRLCAPLVLHDGDAHLRDADSYSAQARAILREGAPFTLS